MNYNKKVFEGYEGSWECCGLQKTPLAKPRRSYHEWIERGSISDDIAKQKGVRELVRCKDCIYGDDFDCPAPLPTGYLCQKGHGPHTGDWFCADGKRKECR